MRGPATEKDRRRVIFFFLLIEAATTIPVTMCIDFLTLNKMDPELLPLLRQARIESAAAAASADGEVMRGSTYQNIPLNLPVNPRTGNYILEKPYNIRLASLKPNSANLEEVKKTKKDAYQTLLHVTFNTINRYNELYGIPPLESLSERDIKGVIISKLESLGQELRIITDALPLLKQRRDQLKQQRDQLRQLKSESPALYTVSYEISEERYESAKNIYERSKTQKEHIKDLIKFLRENYDDLLKLNSNLNLIRRVTQNRSIKASAPAAAAAGAGGGEAAGTGLLLPPAPAPMPAYRIARPVPPVPPAAAAAAGAAANNSNNSLPFPLEGGKKLRSKKQTKRNRRNRKTKRRNK